VVHVRIMLTPDLVLAGLSAIAQQWRPVAIAWHVVAGALLLAMVAQRRSTRLVGSFLVLPLISVSGVAWLSGNPFNGAVFGALSLLLAATARNAAGDWVRAGGRGAVTMGLLLVGFGWVYPHFLDASHWTEYLYAAPLGVLPCPTLAAVIGLTLVYGAPRPVWSGVLVAAGFLYGAIGVFWLGVVLDVGLLAGAAVLVIVTMQRRSVRADGIERTCRLPGDELIPDAIGSLTHATTIDRLPSAVWPWLAQMGAGSRAGWYSYDVVDNGRHPSADRIVPELQTLKVGMVFPALPGITDGFTLFAFEPGAWLVLGWRAPDGSPLTTWTFVLRRQGDATRLIVRARAGRGYRFPMLPTWLGDLVGSRIHGVMQRKQLLGIARRAEAADSSGER
jgi:hypothetical protein